MQWKREGVCFQVDRCHSVLWIGSAPGNTQEDEVGSGRKGGAQSNQEESMDAQRYSCVKEIVEYRALTSKKRSVLFNYS